MPNADARPPSFQIEPIARSLLRMPGGSSLRRRPKDKPRQQHGDEAKRHERNQDDRALRPGSQRVDKGRNLAHGRRIAEIAIVGAEPEIDRHHERDITGAHDQGAAEIVPARAIAEHDDVIDGAGRDQGMRHPEGPEHQRGRSRGQRRLDEGLKRQRGGPKIQSRAYETPPAQQRQRRDQPVEVAHLQRQAGARIEPVPIPPRRVGKPITNSERRQRAAQDDFPMWFQRSANERRRSDCRQANGKRHRVQPAIGNEGVHGSVLRRSLRSCPAPFSSRASSGWARRCL